MLIFLIFFAELEKEMIFWVKSFSKNEKTCLKNHSDNYTPLAKKIKKHWRYLDDKHLRPTPILSRCGRKI